LRHRRSRAACTDSAPLLRERGHDVENHRNEPVDRLVYAYNRETEKFDVIGDDAPVRLTDRHLNEAFVTM